MGLQYMHTMLYQRTTDAYRVLQLSSWISHATLTHTRNVSGSRAVVSICRMPIQDCSFQVLCVSTHKLLIRNRLLCMFGDITRQPYLTSSSDTENRHIRQQSSHGLCRTSITCSFRVLSASTHKMSCRQDVAMHVWIHNSSIIYVQYLAYSSNPANRYL